MCGQAEYNIEREGITVLHALPAVRGKAITSGGAHGTANDVNNMPFRQSYGGHQSAHSAGHTAVDESIEVMRILMRALVRNSLFE